MPSQRDRTRSMAPGGSFWAALPWRAACTLTLGVSRERPLSLQYQQPSLGGRGDAPGPGCPHVTKACLGTSWNPGCPTRPHVWAASPSPNGSAAGGEPRTRPGHPYRWGGRCPLPVGSWRPPPATPLRVGRRVSFRRVCLRGSSRALCWSFRKLPTALSRCSSSLHGLVTGLSAHCTVTPSPDVCSSRRREEPTLRLHRGSGHSQQRTQRPLKEERVTDKLTVSREHGQSPGDRPHGSQEREGTPVHLPPEGHECSPDFPVHDAAKCEPATKFLVGEFSDARPRSGRRQ